MMQTANQAQLCEEDMPARHDERRRFFRVNDTISLRYKLIDEITANAGFEGRLDHSIDTYSLAATLDVLALESKHLMLHMDKQQPEMLELYRVLDAKITAIAQTVMIQNSDLVKQDSRKVNLSATGVAFHNNLALPQGQFLELQMFLPRSMSVIRVYGKVVHCILLAQNDFLISVDYTHIKDDDQELLIKHVVRTQWHQHRESAGKE